MWILQILGMELSGSLIIITRTNHVSKNMKPALVGVAFVIKKIGLDSFLEVNGIFKFYKQQQRF